MGPHESRRLRSTIEYFSKSSGNSTSTSDFRPRSGDIQVLSHNGVGNLNMVTKLKEAKSNRSSKRSIYKARRKI